MIAAAFSLLAMLLWVAGMLMGWTEWQFILAVAVVVGLMALGDRLVFR